MTAGILLLAAGNSRRFGMDKRLAKLPDGERLLDATLKQILATQLPLLVCLGREDWELSLQLGAQGIAHHLCPRSREGMGSTLADGIAALPPWTAVLVALADMPWIKRKTYLAVTHTSRFDRICIPTHLGQYGHPVSFGSNFFSSMASLTGEPGGRQLILDNPARVKELPVNDPGILRDVDGPEDLAPQ